MSRRSEEPLVKITIRVRQADWNTIQEIARVKDQEPNRIIREILKSYVGQTQALVRRNIDKLPPPPAFSIEELSDA